jgi:hypothetical protein
MELFVCLVEAEECFEDIVVHLAKTFSSQWRYQEK